MTAFPFIPFVLIQNGYARIKNKIINAANTETFDANVYEEVVKCYRRVASLLLKNRKIIEQNNDKIDQLIIQRIKLLKRILSAG